VDKNEAKAALDKIITKARVDFYKPIQVAEVLYHKRMDPTMDLRNLESYRSESKSWRNQVTIELLGKISTSSAKYQDDVFSESAVPPEAMYVLGEENIATLGAVEAYIYKAFTDRHRQLQDALDYCNNGTRENFDVRFLINLFWQEPGLKRSLDKMYEIIVYSLFATLTDALELTVEISINPEKANILREFEDFTKNVMCIDFSNVTYQQEAKIYRVGVTNAADRGLDMYANWGPAIQIKHLALDEGLAENIVGSVSSDRIIIVCKSAEQGVIVSLLTQIGWRAKIQSVVTETNLIDWYERALRGNFATVMGDNLLTNIRASITDEFRSIGQEDNILTSRNYSRINNAFWSRP